ncbi:hypothetical protein JTB14_025895 [Gonioctena quinquepunctata]|nr:hypothetical protein JTB14_025895 [Gonioctena quinquepunctata]
MPRTELKHMKQFENKPENTVEILKTQKELNLLLGDIRKEAQRRTKESGDRIQSKLDEDNFKIPTENRYGVLASEEHTQESANDTDAEAKPAKITDSQKRAERRKKKKFRDMGNEQANEQGQIEPGNVTDSKKHHQRVSRG